MLAMLGVCCSANTQYIIHVNSIESNPENAESASKFDILQMEKRFELNWDYYKGIMFNENDFKIRASV